LQAEAAIGQADRLALATGSVVVISGAVDYVTDGKNAIRIANGHPMMTRVTGMGCTATAMIGAFLAVTEQPLIAAAQAMLMMGVAGELARERAKGPGSLQVEFLDLLYELTGEQIIARARLS
jgi:hydroxyethylthiazole kinase